jgi:hypothetical protein
MAKMYTVELSRRQLGTVLAALRYWQANLLYVEPEFMGIAEDEGEQKALTTSDIDKLCMKINCA